MSRRHVMGSLATAVILRGKTIDEQVMIPNPVMNLAEVAVEK